MDACCTTTAPPPLEWVLLFSTGFLISLGHCIGMCGPIIVAFAGAQSGRLGEGRPIRLLPPFVLYHTGRIISYAIIGAAFGLAGSAAALFGPGSGLQGAISIGAGALMLLMGLSLLGLLPAREWVESSAIAARVIGAVRGLISAKSAAGQFGLGVANGFLPCGPVVAVALSAVPTASAPLGALTMLVYGAGTIPALLVLGFGTSLLSPAVRNRFFQAGAVLVMIVAMQLLLRGMSAFGWIGHVRLGEVVFW